MANPEYPQEEMSHRLSGYDDDACVLKKSTSYGSLRTELTASISSSSCTTEEKPRNVPQHLQDVVAALSLQGLVDDSSSLMSSDGVPSEIMVFNDRDEFMSVVQVEDEDNNVEDAAFKEQLKAMRNLISSLKSKATSSERLADSLDVELDHTKMFAEDLLIQRNTLIQTIEDMEETQERRNEQSFLMKMLLCFALVIYFLGGNQEFLVIAVCLYLMADFILETLFPQEHSLTDFDAEDFRDNFQAAAKPSLDESNNEIQYCAATPESPMCPGHVTPPPTNGDCSEGISRYEEEEDVPPPPPPLLEEDECSVEDIACFDDVSQYEEDDNDEYSKLSDRYISRSLLASSLLQSCEALIQEDKRSCPSIEKPSIVGRWSTRVVFPTSTIDTSIPSWEYIRNTEKDEVK